MNETAMIECPDCNGQASRRGPMPWSDEKLCGTCGGSGEVEDDEINEEMEEYDV